MTDSRTPRRNRLLAERPLPRDGRERAPKRGARATRSVMVNLAESPLGWLRARGLVNERQFVAGETLRGDWELASLGPSVTMRWDAPPPGSSARAAPDHEEPTMVQLAAKRRFETAVAAVGAGLTDVLWRVVCAGEGMREAERALDRLADHYRLR
jgi:hypothetical protein